MLIKFGIEALREENSNLQQENTILRKMIKEKNLALASILDWKDSYQCKIHIPIHVFDIITKALWITEEDMRVRIKANIKGEKHWEQKEKKTET